jgi:vesicle-associated membrane protein 7
MTDNTIGRKVPFVFLEDVKTKFKQMYAGRWEGASAYAFNDEFSRILKKQMVR